MVTIGGHGDLDELPRQAKGNAPVYAGMGGRRVCRNVLDLDEGQRARCPAYRTLMRVVREIVLFCTLILFFTTPTFRLCNSSKL